jgi:hypothetical protein
VFLSEDIFLLDRNLPQCRSTRVGHPICCDCHQCHQRHYDHCLCKFSHNIVLSSQYYCDGPNSVICVSCVCLENLAENLNQSQTTLLTGLRPSVTHTHTDRINGRTTWPNQRSWAFQVDPGWPVAAHIEMDRYSKALRSRQVTSCPPSQAQLLSNRTSSAPNQSENHATCRTCGLSRLTRVGRLPLTLKHYLLLLH